jgi:hypothetical protein
MLIKIADPFPVSSSEITPEALYSGRRRFLKQLGPRTRDQTVLHKGEDLKFFTNLSAKATVDCISSPCVQLGNRVPRIVFLYNPASPAERQIPNRLAITSAVSRSP